MVQLLSDVMESFQSFLSDSLGLSTSNNAVLTAWYGHLPHSWVLPSLQNCAFLSLFPPSSSLELHSIYSLLLPCHQTFPPRSCLLQAKETSASHKSKPQGSLSWLLDQPQNLVSSDSLMVSLIYKDEQGWGVAQLLPSTCKALGLSPAPQNNQTKPTVDCYIRWDLTFIRMLQFCCLKPKIMWFGESTFSQFWCLTDSLLQSEEIQVRSVQRQGVLCLHSKFALPTALN